MIFLGNKLALGLLCPTLAAAARYGNVARATTYVEPENIFHLFQDIPDLELYSPIFTMPETVPAGFANGTAGPTPQAVMGELTARPAASVLVEQRFLTLSHRKVLQGYCRPPQLDNVQ